MNPPSLSDVQRMIEETVKLPTLAAEDISYLKVLLNCESLIKEFSAADLSNLEQIGAKLVTAEEGAGELQELIQRIRKIAQATSIEKVLVLVDLKEIYQQDILQKLSVLKGNDQLLIYHSRLYGNESISIRQPDARGTNLKWAAGLPFYRKTSDPKHIIERLQPINEKLEMLLEALPIDFLQNCSPETIEKEIKFLIEFSKLLEKSIKGLNHVKEHAVKVYYDNINADAWLEGGISLLKSNKELLDLKLESITEYVEYLIIQGEVEKLEEKSLNASKIYKETKSSGLSASQLARNEYFIKGFAKDLSKRAKITNKIFCLTLPDEANHLDSQLLPFKINGEHISSALTPQQAIENYVGEKGIFAIMHLLSPQKLEEWLADLSLQFPNQKVQDAYQEIELIVDEYNQVEVVFKMLGGISSDAKSELFSDFFLSKRSFQISLKNLRGDKEFKFKIVDLTSPCVNMDSLQAFHKGANDLSGMFFCALLDFFHKPTSWAQSTIKTVSSMDIRELLLAHTGATFIDEHGTTPFRTGLETLKDMLKRNAEGTVGMGVSFDKKVLTKRKGPNYEIQENIWKDLNRFQVLRLNGKLIYSNISPQCNDVAAAFEAIAKTFGEDPANAKVANVAPIMVTQMAKADFVGAWMRVRAAQCAKGTVNLELFDDWNKETLLDIEIDSTGMITTLSRNIVYLFDSPEDSFLSEPKKGVLVLCEVKIPIGELKAALENKNENLLVNAKSRERVSDLIMLPEQPLEKADEKDIYELLNLFK